MSTFANNRKAFHDYHILEEYEAGLVLYGHEVKSIKNGHVSLKGSYVTGKGAELYLTNAHISPYQHAGEIPGYDPVRSRKLLLKRKEITSLIEKKSAEGLTLVPLSLYARRGLVKLRFGLAKGKKQFDKRETLKRSQAKRDIDRQMKKLTR